MMDPEMHTPYIRFKAAALALAAIATLVASYTALGDVKIANRADMAANRTPQATLEVQTDGTATDSALLIRGPNPSSAQLVRVRDDGNVAVGSGDPEYTLDVDGSARVSDVPTITGELHSLVKNPASGQVSEQITATGMMPVWIDDGPVVFSALAAARTASTAPTINPSTYSNIRRYRNLGNDWVEEEIEINSNGAGGASGSGYYILSPKYPIDTTYHLTYSGNLNANVITIGKTYGINIGQGVISVVTSFAEIFAIPLSSSEIAFGSLAGATGNAFIGNGHFTISDSQWSMKIRITYKKDV
ncbi:hypothetical protein OAS86_04175 [Gammaproteobacteria bacterium]|nr:hypothetical protein [Gammaproteobacteria bacterium]